MVGSNYCRYPPAALALPKVGTYTKPDPEKIALLRPDLVIIQKTAAALADRLSALGIPHAEVRIGSLADVYTMIKDIGRAAGLAEQAEKLNDGIRSHLESVRTETTGARKPTVLIIVGRTPGTLTNLVAVGPSAYLGELLNIAGGSNVMAESAMTYPRISLETVVRANPEVILDLSMMGHADADQDAGSASRNPAAPGTGCRSNRDLFSSPRNHWASPARAWSKPVWFVSRICTSRERNACSAGGGLPISRASGRLDHWSGAAGSSLS